MSRFGTDLASVEVAITSGMPTALASLMGLLISVGLLFGLEWRLAVFSVLGIVLSFYGARLLESRASQANYGMKQEEGKANSLLQENPLHVPDLEPEPVSRPPGEGSGGRRGDPAGHGEPDQGPGRSLRCRRRRAATGRRGVHSGRGYEGA